MTADYTTREFCARCRHVSAVGFTVPTEVWESVAGRHWSNNILCIRCFAELGDEKGIAWETRGIDFYAVSYATHDAFRESRWPGWEQSGAVETADMSPRTTS